MEDEQMVVPEAVEEITPDAGGVSEETPAAEPSVDAPTGPTQADIDRMRSVYDRQVADANRQMVEREQQFNAYLEQVRQYNLEQDRKLFELETKDMDERDKQLYTYQREAESVKQQLAAMQHEREQERMTYQAQQQRMEKIRAFADMTGQSFEKLERTIQTPQDLAKAFQDHYQSLKSAAGKAPPAAPKVSVAKPGSPARGMVDRINIHNPESYKDIIERAALEGIPANEL